MKKDDRVYLRHILECVGRVESYLHGVGWNDFQNDMKTIDATVRNVEVIGEAATNLSEEFRDRHRQISWRKIIGTRNRIVHGYAAVDLETIWDITQNDLPKLKTEIEEILENWT